jgi:hypothetical protein
VQPGDLRTDAQTVGKNGQTRIVTEGGVRALYLNVARDLGDLRHSRHVMSRRDASDITI